MACADYEGHVALWRLVHDADQGITAQLEVFVSLSVLQGVSHASTPCKMRSSQVYNPVDVSTAVCLRQARGRMCTWRGTQVEVAFLQ
jgi:hypothetical protein